MIVVDTNLIAYFFIPGERTEVAEKTFRQDPGWTAPLLWRSEMRNILAQCMSKEDMELEQAKLIMHKSEQLFTNQEYSIASDSVLDFAYHHKLSAYDCEFVALAEHLDVSLVTSDKEILRKFPHRRPAPRSAVRA